MSCITSIVARRKIGFASFGVFVFLSAMSLPVQASTFHMVDAQNATGDMTLDVLSQGYSGGQWNFTLKATNTGSNTYNNVNLMLQFVWDQLTSPESALTYTNSNSWGGTVVSGTTTNSDSFSFGGYGIGASPATTPLVAFPWTAANTPLTWSSPSQATASISSGNTLPTVPLGNFGPGATENFSLAMPSNDFAVDVVGLYVAVPEPSSVVLLVLSVLGLSGYAWRRRAVRR
jgi:hypothetical protein